MSSLCSSISCQTTDKFVLQICLNLSSIFTSVNFMPGHVVRQFHVRQIHAWTFWWSAIFMSVIFSAPVISLQYTKSLASPRQTNVVLMFQTSSYIKTIIKAVKTGRRQHSFCVTSKLVEWLRPKRWSRGQGQGQGHDFFVVELFSRLWGQSSRIPSLSVECKK